MKKLLMMGMIMMMGMTNLVRADGASGMGGFSDLIKSTLIDHVSVVSQLGNGHTRTAAVDSIILIGKYKERSILQIQGGFNRDIQVDDTTHTIWGAQLRLDPFLNDKLNLPESWTFLKSLEWGPALHYDTRKSGWYGYVQLGLAFGLQPKS